MIRRTEILFILSGLLVLAGCDVKAMLEGEGSVGSGAAAEVGSPVEGDASSLAYAYEGYEASEYETALEASNWTEPAYADPDEPPALPASSEYTEPAYVSFVEGEVYLKGTQDQEWTHADLNVIVQEGDALWVDEASRLELELSRGVFLRMAEMAKVDVVSLGADVELKGWEGAFFVTVPAAYRGSIRIEAPGASIGISGGSELRVDIAEDGYTRYTVYAGEVQVQQPEGPRSISATNRFYVEPGSLPSDTEPFDESSYDDFDRWCRSRESRYEVPVGYETNQTASYESEPEGRGSYEAPGYRGGYEPPAYRYTGGYLPGSTELESHGEWIEIESRHYYRPRVPTGWRPYSHGYWSYSQPYGYVWISYDPFGYTTHHYGRWTFRPHYGWIWLPGRVWRPHHCYFASSGPNVMWAPLDPWGRPAYLGRVDFRLGGGIYVDFRSWSFLPRGSFIAGSRHVSVVNLNMFRGPVQLNVIQAPHTMFRSKLPGRTPFILASGGVRIQSRMVSIEKRWKSLPRPGFHVERTATLSKSRVARVKLASAPAKVFDVKIKSSGPTRHVLVPPVLREGKGSVKVTKTGSGEGRPPRTTRPREGLPTVTTGQGRTESPRVARPKVDPREAPKVKPPTSGKTEPRVKPRKDEPRVDPRGGRYEAPKPKRDEPKKAEPKRVDPKPKRDEPKKAEPKRVDPKPRRDEPKKAEPKRVDPRPKRDEPKKAEPKRVDPKPRRDEPKKAEPKRVDPKPKRDEPKKAEPKRVDPRPKRDEPKKAEPKRVDPRPKRDEPKKAEPKRVDPKPKRDEPKRVQPKKAEPKRVDPKPKRRDEPRKADTKKVAPKKESKKAAPKKAAPKKEKGKAKDDEKDEKDGEEVKGPRGKNRRR